MSRIEEYLAAVRRHARGTLTEEAERELRSHLAEAAAAHRRAGLPADAAEAAVVADLGRPEEVGAAFWREQGPSLRRLVHGPIDVIADVRRAWQTVALVALTTALCGALVGQALPPTYQARLPVEVVGRYDFGTVLAIDEAFERLRVEQGVPIHSSRGTRGDGGAVEVEAADRAAAVERAREEADRAVWAFAAEVQRSPFGNPEVSLAVRGDPEVEVRRPVADAAALGGVLGLAAGAILAVRRTCRRRQE